jgi:uncharacterized protein (TIGR02145 family)/uncharacterized repeat protein (TIGR02543 family)
MLKKLLVPTCLSIFILALVLFYCKLPPSPAGPEEANVTLLFKDSNGKLDNAGAIEDSVGKELQIGVILNLTQYIDSTIVRVSLGADTVRSFPWKFKGNTVDTVFFQITFSKIGTYSVEATGYIADQPNIVVKGKIIVYGPPSVNKKPELDVPDKLTVGVEQTVSFYVSATDTNADQKVTITASQKPESATFTADTFRWIPAKADTGTCTVIFIATDNGSPVLTDTASVIINVSATQVNHAPQWNQKSIQRTGKPGSLFSFDLSTFCSDPDNDTITYSLIPEPPAKDTIIGTTYSFTPAAADTGKQLFHIVARDPSGLVDTLTLELTISNNSVADTKPPVFKLVLPVKDSTTVSSSSMQVIVSCKDESKIDTVKCLMGTSALNVAKTGDSLYSVQISTLQTGWNIVTFIARDASPAKNPCTLLVHIKYDKNAPDSLAPVINFQSPSKDTIICVDSFEVKVTCVDDSGCSVKGFRDGTAFTLIKSVSVANLWTGMAKGISAGNYSTIKIVATDTSKAKNKDSASVRIKYDNDKSGPVIVLVNPAKDSVVTNTSSYTIIAKCTDPSGVLLLSGASGATIIPGVRDTGSLWKITINSLENNKVTGIVLTAVDSSLNANKSLDTVYVKSEIINGRTIAFNKNDTAATGTMTNQTINSGASAPLTTNAFSKPGWTFDGWATSPTGIVAYKDGASYTMGTTDVTLYAKWSAKVYNITFDKNDAGAAGTMSTQPIYAGSSAPLATNAFTKAGASFAGWALSPTGVVVYVDKADYTMGTSDVTLYAKWTANSYTISFDKNDAAAAGTMTTQSIASGAAAPLNVNTYSKAGWVFTGWATSPTGAVAYADGSSYTMGAANVTLYALWSQNVLKVTFDKNDPLATGTMTEQSIASGSVVPLKNNSFSKVGYYFAGWATSPTGPVAYADGGNFIMGNSNVVLYATWSLITYTLNVSSATGGSISVPATSPTTVNYGTATTVTAAASAGYNFSNWTVTTGNATIANANSATTTVTLTSGNATVRANFVQITYSLTLSAATGGTITVPETSPATVNHGAATTITAAANSGYNFSNWTITTGTATISNASSATTTVTLTSGDAAVRANFVPITYSLTLSAATGGTITAPATSPATVNHGAATTITAVASSGYNFSNWTVTTGTATIANAGSATTTVTLTSGNATVRANFTQITYSLTISAATGGSISVPASSPIDVIHGAANTITAVANTGYNFSGWTVTTGTATIASANSATTTVTLNSGNAAVRANFTLVPYAISYEYNGGSGSNPPTYNITQTPVSLGVATRLGFTFSGWFDNPGLTGSMVTSIPSGTIGPKSFWAKWVVRDRDGNEYNTVTINGKTWMTTNLKTTTLSDGTIILKSGQAAWGSDVDPQCCYYNYIPNPGAYGALYNAAAANSGKLAPDGWHVATKEDWDNAQAINGAAGLATQGDDWGGLGTNSTGLSLLPGGWAADNGYCSSMGTSSFFWTSTNGSDGLYNVEILNYAGMSIMYNTYDYRYPSYGYSVRCVLDNP